jgi:hypothetical protein
MIYPLTMDYGSLAGDVSVVITTTGWTFKPGPSKSRFERLAVADRLDLRRAFEKQVELAKNTPT